MAAPAASRALREFECQLCALTAPCGYRGRQPPAAPAVLLLEESYVMKDPFTPDKDRFLVLGSRCSVCGRLVCVGPVGVQLVLHQEILPPLCAGEHWCFPPGNSARLGETEGSIKETCQPARLPGLTQGARSRKGLGSWAHHLSASISSWGETCSSADAESTGQCPSEHPQDQLGSGALPCSAGGGGLRAGTGAKPGPAGLACLLPRCKAFNDSWHLGVASANLTAQLDPWTQRQRDCGGDWGDCVVTLGAT